MALALALGAAFDEPPTTMTDQSSAVKLLTTATSGGGQALNRAIEKASPEVAGILLLGKEALAWASEQQRIDHATAIDDAAREERERNAQRQHELDLWQRRDFPLIKLGCFVLISVMVIGAVLFVVNPAVGTGLLSTATAALVGAVGYLVRGAKDRKDQSPARAPDED